MADRKISELTALTAPASGDYVPIVDISEPTAANRNKRITLDVLTSYFRTDGVFSSALGTAATPSITFTGDPNTGIYSPGADQVAISTNGTGRLFVDSSGNIGIGTVSPTALLHVEGDSGSISVGSTSLLRIESPGFATDAGIRFKSGGTTYSQIGSIGGELYAYTSGNERLRITSDGKLGVGTSTPDELLHIKLASTDTASIKLENTDGFHIFKENNGSLTIADSVGDRLSIDSSGNIGIGTVSPVALFHVEGDSGDTSPGSTSLLRVESLGTGTDAGIRFKSGGSTYSQIGNIGGELYAYTSGDERARIDSSGRLLVGTGTNAGGALLQVNGNRIRVGIAKTPASASDTGTAGEICWDSSYIYVCTATDTWKRAALSTW